MTSSELADTLAAYHQASIILRDSYLELGELEATITRSRASTLQSALADNTAITAARELADSNVAEYVAEKHQVRATIDAQLATLRWLDVLLAYLTRQVP